MYQGANNNNEKPESQEFNLPLSVDARRYNNGQGISDGQLYPHRARHSLQHKPPVNDEPSKQLNQPPIHPSVHNTNSKSEKSGQHLNSNSLSYNSNINYNDNINKKVQSETRGDANINDGETDNDVDGGSVHNSNNNNINNDINKHRLWQEDTSKSNNFLSFNSNNFDPSYTLVPPANDETGEAGKAVHLPRQLQPDVKKLIDKGWQDNAFNQYVSDLISIRRNLPDVRDPKCRDIQYHSKLPPTSVIICFHNEAWTVLLRTIHSVLDRSPSHLIHEIILVDDFSDRKYLKEQLDEYVKQFNGIVKIVRASKREGLIRARLLGFEAATGPVITYLDSHCECTEGWLEPLLDRIAQNDRAVVCPVIDVISDKTFEFHFRKDASSINVGGFDWNLQFNWHGVPDRERKRLNHTTDPIYSPTMAGGLFSISRSFFAKLGTYDPGFDIWGGENLELSFKTWMCGGTLEIVPCSHVGHIFRSRSPYKWRSGVNVLKKNSVRLAEVWMDEYKKYYYQRIGNDLGDFGNITERRQLRDSLKCHSFKWYIDNIYPELFVPGDAVASGEIRNLGNVHGDNSVKMCIDSPSHKSDMHKEVGLYPCHGQGGNQYWLLSKEGEIRRDEACLDYSGKEVILYPCHGSKGNQLWIYSLITDQIRHGSSGKCLEMSPSKDKLWMKLCDPSNNVSLNQQWKFENFNASKFVSLKP